MKFKEKNDSSRVFAFNFSKQHTKQFQLLDFEMLFFFRNSPKKNLLAVRFRFPHGFQNNIKTTHFCSCVKKYQFTMDMNQLFNYEYRN